MRYLLVVMLHIFIKQYVLDIINVAKTQNKLICATGDCHYCNKEDKKYPNVVNTSFGQFKNIVNNNESKKIQ